MSRVEPHPVFLEQLEKLRTHGLAPERPVEIRNGEGMLCYYDRGDGHIYLSLPDPSLPVGKLKCLLYRSLTGCQSDHELLEFVDLLLPLLIAHELAHLLRHQRRLFGENLWHEEQVANQFANAMTKRQTPPRQRQRTVFFLRRALGVLGQHLGAHDEAINTYHDPWMALTATGHLRPELAELLRLLHRLLAVQPQQLLAQAGAAFHLAAAQLEHRADQIHAFNREYTGQVARYLAYQFTWMLLDLESREHNYLEEVLTRHLSAGPELLPPPAQVETTPEVLRAYHQAATALAGEDPSLGRYFYKRYRELFLAEVRKALQDQPEAVQEELQRVTEPWSASLEDPLYFLAPLLPERWSAVLPQNIQAAEADFATALEPHTDRRLWEHHMGREDRAAAATAERLRAIEQASTLRSTPAELCLRVAQAFLRVQLEPGEVLIWQGVENSDLFWLTEGDLEVVLDEGGSQPRRLATLGPGEVVGEMAFLSRSPRSATVRALTPATCFVLKERDLNRFAYRHPTLLMSLSALLAQRMSRPASAAPHAGESHG